MCNELWPTDGQLGGIYIPRGSRVISVDVANSLDQGIPLQQGNSRKQRAMIKPFEVKNGRKRKGQEVLYILLLSPVPVANGSRGA